MKETEVISILKEIKSGLEIRVSMLKPDMASYFEKDISRLAQLIAHIECRFVES